MTLGLRLWRAALWPRSRQDWLLLSCTQLKLVERVPNSGAVWSMWHLEQCFWAIKSIYLSELSAFIGVACPAQKCIRTEIL